MSVVAELHNGTQIHFPDGTPDHEVDAAVKRHLGVTSAPAADPDLMTALMGAIGAHASNLAGQRSQETQQKAQTEDQHRKIQHKTHVVTSAAKVEAIKGTGQAFQQSMSQLMEPLSALAINSSKVPELIMALNNLSATILEIGKAVISTMHAPKEIYHGADGKPRGTRIIRQQSGGGQPPSGSPPENKLLL